LYTTKFQFQEAREISAQAGQGGKSRRCPARGMTRDIFKSAWSLQTATMQPGNSGGALVD
jgi:hypothetical protein